jgi:phosphate transport system substrate-binding protein
MKINIKKIAVLAAAMTMTMGLMVGCNTTETETTTAEGETTEAVDDLSGTITMAGSTSMEKLANALAETYMAEHTGVTVTAEFTGSSAGIEALTAGTVDIANASRALADEEKAAGLVENVVALDGIAVVVDPANTVEDISKADLAKIYTGEIKNWSELGGEDQPIVVIGRESGSGTRDAFEELVEVEEKCVYSNELDSTGAVVAKVAATKGAIGYVSLDVVDDTVKAVKLEGVEVSAETIKAGEYFLSRPFVMATMGEISEQSAQVQNMFEYLSSEEGKSLIESVGLITVD